MKGWHKANGWLYKMIGGPLDGWFLRAHHSEAPEIDSPPPELLPLSERSDGVYRARLNGKTAKKNSKTYEAWEYEWELTA